MANVLSNREIGLLEDLTNAINKNTKIQEDANAEYTKYPLDEKKVKLIIDKSPAIVCEKINRCGVGKDDIISITFDGKEYIAFVWN